MMMRIPTGVPISQQNCRNCSAFALNPDFKQAPGRPKIGACCAAPPALVPGLAPVPGSQLTPQGPQMQHMIQGMWPPVSEDKWCRAWEPKEDDNDRDN